MTKKYAGFFSFIQFFSSAFKFVGSLELVAISHCLASPPYSPIQVNLHPGKMNLFMYEVVSLSSIDPGQIESTFYFVKLSLSRAGNAQSSSWGFSSETLLIFTIESSLTHIGFLALLLTMMICSI